MHQPSKTTASALCVFSLFILLLAGCRKEITPAGEPLTLATETPKKQGHLKQTKSYSSEAAFKWIDLKLRLLSMPPQGGLIPGRMHGYFGIAMYESVVAGMPAYQSIAGQLNGLQAMPATEPGKAYHWPAVVNASMSAMMRSFFPNTSAPNKASIDSLELALLQSFATEVDEVILQRSAAFGKEVARLVFEWSQLDGFPGMHPIDPPNDPLITPGIYVATPPTFAASNTGYWGGNRQMVRGSLDGTAPPPPLPYSTVPGSPYYNMVKEVYDISQSLTPEQIATAFYYRDNPGYGTGHYLSILKQVLMQEHATLDVTALSYAMTGIALTDAAIGCWQAKYRYQVERPITYIRNVLGHSSWLSLLVTPNHPDYPSGHSTVSGAFATLMTEMFGEDYHFVNHTYDYLGMAPRSFTSFRHLSEEIGMSRVYAGIHNRNACENGRAQGEAVAKNLLRILQFKK